MEHYSDGTRSCNGIHYTKQDYSKVVELQTKLHRYAISLIGYGDSADELLQDSLLHIMLQQDKYKPYGNFYGWASRLMHNSFVNSQKRKMRYRKVISEICMQYNTLETDAESAPDAESLYCADEIMEIIGRLPMRQRQVVDLRLCGYKYNDIAEELGTSVGNVKNSMFLARKNLKRMLGE